MLKRDGRSNFQSPRITPHLVPQESGIPVPHHIVVDRDGLPEGEVDPPGFIETEDYVEMGGATLI